MVHAADVLGSALGGSGMGIRRFFGFDVVPFCFYAARGTPVSCGWGGLYGICRILELVSRAGVLLDNQALQMEAQEQTDLCGNMGHAFGFGVTPHGSLHALEIYCR